MDVENALSKLRVFRGFLINCMPFIRDARSKATSSDLAKLEEGLGKRKALKAKLVEPLKGVIEAWTLGMTERDRIELEKSQAQTALRRYVESAVTAKQEAVNDILECFGASFRLVDAKASFVGRQPNTEYSIGIGSHIVKVGETQSDKPSFNTVLSAGDKFTLALAFFLAQVRSTADLSSATVVLDDPFSSQDMHRQWETTSQLRALAREACQVIIFSHYPRFLALIEKNDGALCDMYQLTCCDDGIGTISTWSSADELKDIYVRQAERIREYTSTGKFLDGVNAESLIKDLRPFLEDVLRARFPGRFGRLVMLDGMTKAIEQAGPDDPFFKHLPAFRAVNEYTRDNMHGGASLPDPMQLRTQCRRIISIVGSY